MNDTEKQKIREEWIKTSPQNMPIEYMNIVADYWLSILDKTIKSKLEAVAGALDRHCNWTPTEGYGSEEEKAGNFALEIMTFEAMENEKWQLLEKI